ncbi:MAG: hypothetical protein JST40_12770 [Armatimonadetes bacterium]|nr:hypothetical protein [Armatimonadota bacterium]
MEKLRSILLGSFGFENQQELARILAHSMQLEESSAATAISRLFSEGRCSPAVEAGIISAFGVRLDLTNDLAVKELERLKFELAEIRRRRLAMKGSGVAAQKSIETTTTLLRTASDIIWINPQWYLTKKTAEGKVLLRDVTSSLSLDTDSARRQVCRSYCCPSFLEGKRLLQDIYEEAKDQLASSGSLDKVIRDRLCERQVTGEFRILVLKKEFCLSPVIFMDPTLPTFAGFHIFLDNRETPVIPMNDVQLRGWHPFLYEILDHNPQFVLGETCL